MKIKKIAEEKFQPMSDEDRERLGLSKRDQSQFNAYMGIGRMIREIREMTPEQSRDDWKQRTEDEINRKGFASVTSLFINHYNVGIRIGVDGKYEAFLTDFKGWQSPEEQPQYPDISKSKRDKPLARFPDLNNAYSWVKTQFLEQARKNNPDKFCPGCENPIDDEEVNDPQYEVTVVHGQRWHTSCWRENGRERNLVYQSEMENDPQEELPSDREAKSLWQMSKTSKQRYWGPKPPRKRSRPQKDIPPLYPDDPLARTVSDAGGVLIKTTIPPFKPGENGGCGAPTHVPGTNGGTMPCGSMLKGLNGEFKPHYCPLCEDAMSSPKRKTRTAQVIPDDGLADGGARYTDEEMDLMEGKIQPTPEEQPKVWHVKVTFDDGEVMETRINGTRDEIRMYYLSNDFVLGDETTMHKPIEVEFINEISDVPWTYWGEAARLKADKQAKSLWQLKKISP